MSAKRSLDPASRNACCDDYERLLESGDHSDFRVVAGGKEIRVHKAILAARSPFFAAMFSHEMRESREGRVVISDLGYEVTLELLRFLYCGRVEDRVRDDEDMCRGLLVAADKYGVDALKEQCDLWACEHLGEHNAVASVQLGHLHRASHLRVRAAFIIVRRARKFCRSAEYRALSEDLRDRIAGLLANCITFL